MSIEALKNSDIFLGTVEGLAYVKSCVYFKNWEGPELSPLAKLEALQKQEVKVKEGFSTAGLFMVYKNTHIHTHTQPFGKAWDI